VSREQHSEWCDYSATLNVMSLVMAIGDNWWMVTVMMMMMMMMMCSYCAE